MSRDLLRRGEVGWWKEEVFRFKAYDTGFEEMQ